MNKNKPEISVVLGTYNRLRFLKPALESIRKELQNLPHEIIVIDGSSADGTLKWLIRQKDIITIVQHNRGKWRGEPIKRRTWGYFMNLGFKCAQGKYVCMLSDDCIIVPGAIFNGYRLFVDKINKGEKIGAVAFYFRNRPDMKKYHVAFSLGKLVVNHGLFLKKALEDVNYIDEDRYCFYHADGDLCLKMWQKGWAVIESPDSYIEHYSHARKKAEDPNLIASNFSYQKEDWNNYMQKWKGIYYFGPNENNLGGTIKKEYKDPNNTASQFVKIARKGLIRRFLRKVLNKAKSYFSILPSYMNH